MSFECYLLSDRDSIKGNFVISGSGFPKKHMGDRAIRDVKQYCPCSELSGEKEHNQKNKQRGMNLQSQLPIPSPENLRPKFIDCLQISVTPGHTGFPRPPRLSAAFWIVLLLR